ncbi:MAG: hypothetical protein JKY03_03770, partial [Aureispira sp.]|nr:hypothetical protein [Aureispira sp.]
MPNPDENNSPVKNKEKSSKEFAQENDTPKRESINVESNYKSKGAKPVSVNIETANESRAIGNQTTKKPSNNGMGAGGSSEDPKLSHSAGSMGGDPKSTHSGGSGDLSPGRMGSEPKKHVAETPKGDPPKVNGTQSSGSGLDEVPTETAKKDNPKQEKPSGDEPGSSGDSKKKAPKEKKKEIVVPAELKSILDVMGSSSKNDDKGVPTGSSDKDGGKKVAEALEKLNSQKNADSNPEDTNGTSDSTSTPTKAGAVPKKGTGGASDQDAKKAADAKALTDFSVTETDAEIAADAEISGFKSEGKTEGLTVGRSVGYGAMIEPIEGGKFNITKFSENDDAKEEQEAKNTYIQESDKIAKNMDEFGAETRPESDEDIKPKEGYYDAYIEGYNEGHREGATLKKEAAAASRTAQMKKEQGTDEYMVGASLGMLCGTLTAKGEKEVDTTFSMTIDRELKFIELKTTVAELDSAAFDKKQTPGGELSGAVYEKAFLLHYNMGYREGRDQRTQPPPMDDDYKLGYEQGYKLGNQKGKGEAGDPDLVKVEKAYDAKDQQALKKDELQQYRGFYAGYNKGYAQVAASKKSKAQTEREEKNKKPKFILGYSTGNLKGFLMAMIEPSGIDLATALKSTAKMTEAGIP